MAGPAARISVGVAELLAGSPPGQVELVVSLHEDDSGPVLPSDRRGLVVRRERFDEWSAPVASYVRGMGGEVLERAWINATLKVSVPASSVRELARHARVRSVELATRL